MLGENAWAPGDGAGARRGQQMGFVRGGTRARQGRRRENAKKTTWVGARWMLRSPLIQFRYGTGALRSASFQSDVNWGKDRYLSVNNPRLSTTSASGAKNRPIRSVNGSSRGKSAFSPPGNGASFRNDGVNVENGDGAQSALFRPPFARVKRPFGLSGFF